MTTIQVENLSDIKRKVTVEVPREIVENTITTRYKELGKTAQIKGFRKGKVPLSILKGYFRKEVEAEAVREIIEQTLEPKLKEENITTLSVVKIDPETLAEDKPFIYTAEIEVPPKVEVADYKGLDLVPPPTTVEQAAIDGEIEALRGQHARLIPLAEGAQTSSGDHVVVDVAAECEGQELKELTVSEYHLELGRDFFVPDFDSQLEGMKNGETRRFSMDFGEEFPRKALAGKSVSFAVTLKDAKQRVLPALDDDFAKDLGEFETLDQLKASVGDRVQKALELKSGQQLREQIITALIEKHAIEVPEFMIESQIDRYVDQTLGSLINYGIDPRTVPPDMRPKRDNFRDASVRMVKAGLILKAISEAENLAVSDEELQAGIEERAREANVSSDHMRDQIEKAGALDEFRNALLNDKVFDLIKAHATFSEAAPPASEDPPEPEDAPKPTKKKRKERSDAGTNSR
ncbi:MAG: trigger factor [Thermodesulfobacteriota bacterium]